MGPGAGQVAIGDVYPAPFLDLNLDCQSLQSSSLQRAAFQESNIFFDEEEEAPASGRGSVSILSDGSVARYLGIAIWAGTFTD